MAIVFDNTSKGSATASSLTVSHTTAGSNRLLLVGGVSINDTVDVVTGITYNGVAMTRLNSNAVGTVARSYVYWMVAPASGTNDWVVSASSGTRTLQFQGLSYTGVNQTGQPDASAASVASANANITNTLTTVANNCIHIGYFRADSSAPNGTTGTFIVGPGSPGTEGFYISNPTPVTPAGSNSIQVSSAGLQAWSVIGASFSPSTAAAVNSNFLAFM